MSLLHQEDLSQILFLCGEECGNALIFKTQFAHLKVCIDLIFPFIENDSDTEETAANISISQRALDSFETIHNLLCECTSEDSMMGLLANYADNSATICNAFYTLIDLAIAYSMNVKLNLIATRWASFCMQLTDWKHAIELLDVFIDTLREDPRHSKTDLENVETLRKKIIIQFPEPDLFQRIKSFDIFTLHSFNEPRSVEGDSEIPCVPAGDTSFAIFSSSSGGVPVACKTIKAVSLKNGANALKAVADLYLLTDATASPYVHSMLKVCFPDQDAVNMIFSLPPLGNLKAMLTTYQKARKRTVGDTGSHEAWLAEHRRVEGKLSVMSDVVAALCYLHAKGVVHGRLRPSNVLVFDGHRARVTDFGMSHLLKLSPAADTWLRAGRAARAAGTPPPDSAAVPYSELPVGEGGIRWLAPELLLIPPPAGTGAGTGAGAGAGDEYGDLTDPRYASDKYAVAMVMYYLITEKVPYFNIIWSEGVYNVLINGDRPSFDTHIPDCQGKKAA
jgi:hypothetical protein